MIRENIENIKVKIEKAKRNRKEDREEEVLLIAVTKNHSVSAMREAIAAGISVVGENRIQEAQNKFKEIGNIVKWHLIGHLQTNKVKQAVEIFDLIHSIDSEHLLLEVDKVAKQKKKIQDILLQVNLAREDSKFGIYKEDLQSLLMKTQELQNVRLLGLMCIAPNFENRENCRPIFAEMNKIFREAKDLQLKKANIKYLSMGMTNDYHIAVEEGANIVRVGTAIFGKRDY